MVFIVIHHMIFQSFHWVYKSMLMDFLIIPQYNMPWYCKRSVKKTLCLMAMSSNPLSHGIDSLDQKNHSSDVTTWGHYNSSKYNGIHYILPTIFPSYYIYITYIQYITYPKYIYILYIYYLYILSIYIYPLYPFCLLDSHHLPHSPTVSPLPPHQRALPPGAFRAGRPRIELPQLWNMTTLPCFFGKDNG
jgi:hypothetical protein